METERALVASRDESVVALQTKLSAAAGDAAGQASLLAAERAQLTTELATASRELAEKTKQLSELQASLATSESSLAGLREQLTQVGSDKDAASAAFNHQITTLQEQVKGVRTPDSFPPSCLRMGRIPSAVGRVAGEERRRGGSGRGGSGGEDAEHRPSADGTGRRESKQPDTY